MIQRISSSSQNSFWPSQEKQERTPPRSSWPRLLAKERTPRSFNILRKCKFERLLAKVLENVSSTISWPITTDLICFIFLEVSKLAKNQSMCSRMVMSWSTMGFLGTHVYKYNQIHEMLIYTHTLGLVCLWTDMYTNIIRYNEMFINTHIHKHKNIEISEK